MNEHLMLALAVAAGGLLGGFFFGGLWWTVHRGVRSTRPVLWFFGSLLIRTVITLAGFYAVADGHWQRFLACLAGFVAVRFVVLRRVRRDPVSPAKTAQE